MKIKDPAHAVRVLEALIEQGERGIPAGGYTCWASAPLIEGAKAVLEVWYSNEKARKEELIDATRWKEDKFESWDTEWYGRISTLKKMVFSIAQAYAPRMAKAGMEIPE